MVLHLALPHFRRRREIAGAAALLVTLILLFSSTFSTGTSSWRLAGTKDAPSLDRGYPYVRPSPLRGRLLVVAALEHEHVSWVSESFPSWQVAVYPMAAGFSRLDERGGIIDRGPIANAYFAYLVENCFNLPPTMVFLTPHRNTEADTKTKAKAQTNLSLGKYRLLDEYRVVEVAVPKAWEALFPDTPVPERLAAPCCAEFAVSRDQVRRRTIEEYKRFWEWLNKTSVDDETVGLVLEALWHMVFGRGPVDCEDVGVKAYNGDDTGQ
ncbi:hypothetical protein K504DRAFT_538993 [Pleomassaria siparia CBS 279.74]|uniref:Uncharacterized protein n=1 Tax=Pleomassaria siparia CBS 279.74 TaxID=1314801 RepID=A0A6G1JRI2_9PLEO|nr:hypothetical protein K504DRAFT_538993 [Pleomassaria siparia CBS 279.74]